MDTHTKIKDFFAGYPLQLCEKGHILVQAGTEIPTIFYIEEGRINQYDITSSGLEVVVNVFKPGAFFPMSAALNNTPNHYFFQAAVPSRVRVVPKADAVQFLKDNPGVALDLLARVYRGVDGVLRRMAHLMGGDAHTRLLFEVLNAAYRFGEQQSDGSVIIPLTESDLGKTSGLARETVNRELRKLKQGGVVQVGTAGIVVADLTALEKMLDTTV